MKAQKTLKHLLIYILALTSIFFFPVPQRNAHAELSKIESSLYAINRAENILHGIELSTTDSDLKNNLNNPASMLIVKNRDGSPFSGGSLYTGMTVALSDGTSEQDALSISVCGDPSGNGTLTITDYTMARLHILSLKMLSGEYKTAADINGDGVITITDYTLMRLDILGLKKIVPYSSSLPLCGCVVGIDPGHQAHANYEQELISPYGTATKAKVSAGTYGRFTGVSEYVINLQVSLKLKEKLEALGATVIMTRETHEVDISNAQRAVMMNGIPVDCWIRIHANGSTDPSKKGMFFLIPSPGTMYTSDADVQTKSSRLASYLLPAAIGATGAESFGIVQRSDQTSFCWSSVPVCTIEMGHMTNETEDHLLVSDDYQEKIAQGLANGFFEYFS